MILGWLVASFVALAAGLTFIVGYGRIARGMWFRYPVGWHLMGMAVTLTVGAGVVLYRQLVGEVDGAVWLTIASFLATLMWVQVGVLLTVPRPSSNERRMQRKTPEEES